MGATENLSVKMAARRRARRNVRRDNGPNVHILVRWCKSCNRHPTTTKCWTGCCEECCHGPCDVHHYELKPTPQMCAVCETGTAIKKCKTGSCSAECCPGPCPRHQHRKHSCMSCRQLDPDPDCETGRCAECCPGPCLVHGHNPPYVLRYHASTCTVCDRIAATECEHQRCVTCCPGPCVRHDDVDDESDDNDDDSDGRSDGGTDNCDVQDNTAGGSGGVANGTCASGCGRLVSAACETRMCGKCCRGPCVRHPIS